ncbi:ferredoxin-type protein NapF [Vibrio maerlii]|uniref:ferredoxin-type protein NapF n=1 Tax=Vibrio maerlii TaxID=2231648 RepID=UPI000E3ED07F|nr:ferredoxin-type protein NapF [Vibrio maerlii]
MTESINNSRRGFLTRLSKPVQSIQQEPESTPRTEPRPPRAVDEALFLRLCDGCGECQKACPNSVIDIHEGAARLNLEFNECSLCGECVNACPTDALHSATPISINLRPSFSQGCNNYLQIDCKQCQFGCPQSAITVEEGELPKLDIEKCNGCGQCRSSCYMGAISMEFVA